jgi:competence protein ComEA
VARTVVASRRDRIDQVVLKEEPTMKRVLMSIGAAALLLPFLALAGPVNINTADAKTIAKELKGIGLSRAQAIVAHREKNGPFKSADDLARVKGVGMKVVEQNRANIKVEKAEKTASAAPSEKSSTE